MPLYSDFSIAFTKDDLSGDLMLVEDERAVIQSVKALVLTCLYERPFQPAIGSVIYRLLFEPFDAVTKTLLATTIKDTLDQFEPRATLKGVELFEGTGPDGEVLDSHAVVVVVTFAVQNLPSLVSASFTLRRER